MRSIIDVGCVKIKGIRSTKEYFVVGGKMVEGGHVRMAGDEVVVSSMKFRESRKQIRRGPFAPSLWSTSPRLLVASFNLKILENSVCLLDGLCI